MNIYYQHRTEPSINSSTKTSKQYPKHNRPKNLILLIGIVVISVFMGIRELVEFDKDGKPRLAKWRQEKLDRELEELDNAEQYALIAARPDWYPCYNCGDKPEIFLYPSEIWKYGVTRKGKDGRYSKGLPADGLAYVIQFRGTLQECLRQEKLKIYEYVLLPENQKRDKILIRPPGNKIDH